MRVFVEIQTQFSVAAFERRMIRTHSLRRPCVPELRVSFAHLDGARVRQQTFGFCEFFGNRRQTRERPRE